MTQLTNSDKPSTLLQPSETDGSAPPPAPQKTSHRWVCFVAGTVAIAGIGVGIWYSFFRPQNENMVQFSGRIEGYETDVSTKGSGRIEEVTVREGSAVTKGQLLVRLDDDEIRAELAAATAQVEAAKQREAAARLQISVLESQGVDAKLNLQQSEGDTAGKVVEAEALVATAQATLKQEQARVEEVRALLEQTRVDRDRYASLATQGAETQQLSRAERQQWSQLVVRSKLRRES